MSKGCGGIDGVARLARIREVRIECVARLTNQGDDFHIRSSAGKTRTNKRSNSSNYYLHPLVAVYVACFGGYPIEMSQLKHVQFPWRT